MDETIKSKRKRGFKYLKIGFFLIVICFFLIAINNPNVNSRNSQYIPGINHFNSIEYIPGINHFNNIKNSSNYNSNNYNTNCEYCSKNINTNNNNSNIIKTIPLIGNVSININYEYYSKNINTNYNNSNIIQTIPLTGNISINSSPTGAEIYLDNKNKGKTPNILNNIKVGTHAITLVHAGYENWSIYVKVNSDETTLFSAALTSKTDMSSNSIDDQKQSSDSISYSTIADSSKKAPIPSTLAPKTDVSPNSIVDLKQSTGLTFDTNLITAIISLIAAIAGLISSGFGVFLVIISYVEKKKDKQQ